MDICNEAKTVRGAVAVLFVSDVEKSLEQDFSSSRSPHSRPSERLDDLKQPSYARSLRPVVVGRDGIDLCPQFDGFQKKVTLCRPFAA
jgi:hypothetical protein